MSDDLFKAGFVRFSKWCAAVGLARTTAYRLRKAGHLVTFTRYGKTFITRQASEAFVSLPGEPPNQPV